MKTKRMTYAEAISNASVIALSEFENTCFFGIGVTSSVGIFGTTLDAYEMYGPRCFIDTPAMENSVAGIAAGASLVGLKPVVVHSRNDFMFLSLDQIVNVYSKWSHMYDGNAGHIGVVTRGIIGRGWGQGATHSQSIQATLAHFPGLRVVMPAFPSDAKGMFLSAISSKDPVIILEHRNLYSISEEVEVGIYQTPLEGARVVRKGSDLTIAATSICVHEALTASIELEKAGISAEVIDLRVIQPLDFETIVKSIKTTKRLMVVDTSWTSFGISAEIGAKVLELKSNPLISPLVRIGQSPNPAPVSKILEDTHYPSADTIFQSALRVILPNSRINYNPETTFDNFFGPY